MRGKVKSKKNIKMGNKVWEVKNISARPDEVKIEENEISLEIKPKKRNKI